MPTEWTPQRREQEIARICDPLFDALTASALFARMPDEALRKLVDEVAVCLRCAADDLVAGKPRATRGSPLFDAIVRNQEREFGGRYI